MLRRPVLIVYAFICLAVIISLNTTKVFGKYPVIVARIYTGHLALIWFITHFFTPNIFPNAKAKLDLSAFCFLNCEIALWLHSAVCIIISITLCFGIYDETLWNDWIDGKSWLSEMLVAFEIGYTYAEISDCILRNYLLKDKMTWAHHGLLLCGQFTIAAGGRYHSFNTIAQLVQIHGLAIRHRTILKLLGINKRSFLYRLNSFFNFVSALTTRLLLHSWLLWKSIDIYREGVLEHEGVMIWCAIFLVSVGLNIWNWINVYRIAKADWLPRRGLYISHVDS